MDAQEQQFDVRDLLDDLAAGTFAAKVSVALQQAARGVVNHDNDKVKGKVTIAFDISRVGQGNQVSVAHSLETKIPTKRGHKGEKDTTATVMYVANSGAMTIMPANQKDMFRNGEDV